MGQYWKKQEKARKIVKLLNIITELKEANFSILKEKMQPISDPTLSRYIKTLEEQPEKIEHFLKEDRRETWYKIKEDQRQVVNAQISQYQSIQFIEGLNNPFVFTDSRKGKTVSLFIEWENVEKGSPLEKSMGKAVNLISKLLPVNAIPGKFALVVTRDKRKLTHE
ncbi:MAG: hypothetical protein ABSA75_07460 [Candidatus Bathyarchaeia archaeon]|jgi:hypothetical protein